MLRYSMPCLRTNCIFFFGRKRKGLSVSGNQRFYEIDGAIAQLGERLPCTQEVSGSIPLSSTIISCTKPTSECTGNGVLRSICSLIIRNKLKIETTHCFCSP